MKIKALPLLICICFIYIISPSAFAQQDTDQKEQRREIKIEESADQIKRPQTVKELIEYLKQRAMLKVKAKRKERLLKTKLSASVSYGFDTNVPQDSSSKGDFYVEEYFNFSWQPTFNRFLGLKTGYWLLNDNYQEQTDFNFLDHAANISLVLTPFENGRIKLEPGFEYEWVWCSRSAESNYDNTKLFFKFKQYLGKRWDWNYGLGYEYANKLFDEKKARDANREDTESAREDKRHSIDVYLTKYWGKFNFTVRGKFYINFSNEQYIGYYDYYSLRPSLTIGCTFLKDDKLYIAFNPSFERKNYMHRTAIETARFDNLITYMLSAYYTFKKPYTLTYQFIYRHLGSNEDTARYKGITNVIGLSLDF